MKDRSGQATTRHNVAERYAGGPWPQFAMSEAEIGRRLGLSRQRVQQILKQAIEKIRAGLESER